MDIRASAAVALACALVFAACAGDDDDSTSEAAPSSAATTAAPTTTTTIDPRDTPAAPSAGCESTTPIAPGDETVTMQSGGVDRQYIRHVPPSYQPASALPLVLNLHGYAEPAPFQVSLSGLPAYGDEHEFVTITPYGQVDPPRWAIDLAGADVAYIGDLLDEADRTLCIDDNRVYVTGLSNGAMMTSAVACAYSDRIAAAAPVAGIWQIDGCAFDRAVPVVAFHGTEDNYLPYDGGFGGAVASLPTPGGGTMGDQTDAQAGADASTGPSVPDNAAAWAARNGCDDIAPAENAVASDVAQLVYACPPGVETELYRVDGGGHAWPGSETSKAIESAVGPTTFSIDATALMWAFFEMHPLPVQGS
jgi:polyhydroxybutyrate depolymerase